MAKDSYAEWRGEFAKAIDPRFYTLDYLDWLLRTGQANLWVGLQCALVTRVKLFPSGNSAVEFLVAAGDLDELTKELAPSVEQWGRENGCMFALIESRPGWERAMKRHGYELFQASIVKEL